MMLPANELILCIGQSNAGKTRSAILGKAGSLTNLDLEKRIQSC
jgi:hypothetical protein